MPYPVILADRCILLILRGARLSIFGPVLHATMRRTRRTRISGSRFAAEGRYRELRRVAFRAAETDLLAAGIEANLHGIDAEALGAFANWSDRRVSWPWQDMAAEWRRDVPERFELAVWRDGILCGLALGRPSRGPSHIALYYVEGNTDPAHPLRRKLVSATLAALRAYAIALGKAELRLVDPLPALIPVYCSPALGFELVTPRKEAPYCGRSL